MTDTTDKKRRHLTDAETFKAYGLMTANLHQVLVDGADALFAYDQGWSDQRIADEIGCTLTNVVGLRERNFGKLTKAPEIVRDPRLGELIAAHNEFVRDVMVVIANLNPGLAWTAETYLVETK